MSETNNRGINDFSKYDSMATEELEQILRLDTEMPAGQESDEELLLYVMGVLAQRKQNSNDPGKTVNEAWESFQAHYLPGEEDCAQAPAQDDKRTGLRLHRWIAVAAVVAVLVSIPLAANAFNWKGLWNAVAKWASETFSFVTGPDKQIEEPAPSNVQSYSSLKEALEATNRDTDMIPTWIPEGYQLESIKIDENPMHKVYMASYKNGNQSFIIRVRFSLRNNPELLEKENKDVEEYELSGNTYYIFPNLDKMCAGWIKDSYECYVSGDLTVEEIKEMIGSIGKG